MDESEDAAPLEGSEGRFEVKTFLETDVAGNESAKDLPLGSEAASFPVFCRFAIGSVTEDDSPRESHEELIFLQKSLSFREVSAVSSRPVVDEALF